MLYGRLPEVFWDSMNGSRVKGLVIMFIPKFLLFRNFQTTWSEVMENKGIFDKTVYVDYIVDCRQDYGWLIQ
jgi:hypothetical protein